MSQLGSPLRRDKDRSIDAIKYPLIHRASSDPTARPTPNRSPTPTRSFRQPLPSNHHLDPVPDMLSYLLMKQKFEHIYKRIEKIAVREEGSGQLVQRKSLGGAGGSLQAEGKVIHFADGNFSPQICKLRTSHLHQKRYIPELNESLEINTVSEPEFASRLRASNPITHVQLMQKSRYHRKMLEPLGRVAMSNSIKDYLSVEKIALKEMEDSLVGKAKLFKQYNLSNLLFKNPDENDSICPDKTLNFTTSPPKHHDSPVARRTVKFKPPFDLYYYRDFIWRVGFSNEMVVGLVEEYESKVKFFVGGGNNSNLIKGIMKRRPWFALTDKQAEAQFVWTQIKVSSIFTTQRKGEPTRVITEEERKRLAGKAKKGEKAYSILNEAEKERWEHYWLKHVDKERKIKENLTIRSKLMGISETELAKVRSTFRLHNHFTNNFMIGNKKALFKTMSEYYAAQNKDVFQYLPLTFHIKNGIEDDEYLKFLQHFYAISKTNKSDPNSIHKFNAWIVKPGQNTNRGNGIIVCLQLNEIKAILKRKEKHNDGSLKTYILQKYIERPLLYKRRKFDLRHYIMLNCSNGKMKGYWYKEGYVRTTSSEYTLKFSSGSIHLTNDAVQKNLPDYGKYEKGNKTTYEELDAYIKKQDPSFDFFKMVYPKMKQVASDAIRASALNIDPDRRANNFEVFGLDFMIDENYSVWLIEINTNPCLETTCPVLNKIIPRFIENAFQICIDPLFPAPLAFLPKYPQYLKNLNEENYFDLVFDERMEGACEIGASVLASRPQQEDDVFDDDGEDFGDDCA